MKKKYQKMSSLTCQLHAEIHLELSCSLKNGMEAKVELTLKHLEVINYVSHITSKCLRFNAPFDAMPFIHIIYYKSLVERTP